MKRLPINYRTLMTMLLVCGTLIFNVDAFGQPWEGCHSCGTDNSCSGAFGNGDCAFSAGESAQAAATNSICIGYKSVTNSNSSLTFGNLLSTISSASDNMVLGFGDSPSALLSNNISNSIMIGANSTKPTMFFEDAAGRIVKRIKTTGARGLVRVYSSELGTGMFVYSLVKDGSIVRSETMVSSKH